MQQLTLACFWSRTLTGPIWCHAYAVWNELEKENKEFFEAYSQSKSSKDRMSEAETSEMIQKMISESDSSKNSND